MSAGVYQAAGIVPGAVSVHLAGLQQGRLIPRPILNGLCRASDRQYGPVCHGNTSMTQPCLIQTPLQGNRYNRICFAWSRGRGWLSSRFSFNNRHKDSVPVCTCLRKQVQIEFWVDSALSLCSRRQRSWQAAIKTTKANSGSKISSFLSFLSSILQMRVSEGVYS